jgi:hypothetical protein
MKKIVFLAHDPGGYDVVFPIVQRLQHEDILLEFYCVGPAAALNTYYAVSEEMALSNIKSMILKKEIAGLVTGTSWGSKVEVSVIGVCKRVQVPTFSILDYWSNYQNRFRDDSDHCIYPDYFIVMDELAKQEAVQDGVPAHILRALGHPGLDKYVAYQGTRSCSNKKKKKILFLSQPLSALYGKELGYTEKQALEDCIRAVGKAEYCSLYVKFHPKDNVTFQQQYANIAVKGNLSDIMPEYDVVIGMNTMGLLHAVLMGIPSISYQPNLRQNDVCITNKLGLTRLISSYKELQFSMNNNIDGQVITNESLLQKFIWLDGNSTERVVGLIMEVLLHEN